jgi:hypothetical protein
MALLGNRTIIYYFNQGLKMGYFIKNAVFVQLDLISNPTSTIS